MFRMERSGVVKLYLTGFFGGVEDLTSRISGWGRLLSGRSEEWPVTAEVRSGLMVFGRFDLKFDAQDRDVGEPTTVDSNGAQKSVLPVPRSAAAVSKKPATDVGDRRWTTAVSERRATGVVPQPATEDEVFDTVARRESAIVERLVSDGVLTSDGPITDDDVGIMLGTSVISAELSEQLLGLIDRSYVDGPLSSRGAGQPNLWGDRSDI